MKKPIVRIRWYYIKYSVVFTEMEKPFFISLQYNGSNSFLFVDGVKIYQFKVKDLEIKPYSFCLCNISEDFTVENMIKTGLHG